MTWEPTDREVAAYIEGAGQAAMSDGLPAVNRAQYVTRAGLQAAYEKLGERLNAQQSEFLSAATDFVRSKPPLVQYTEADNIEAADRAAMDGWRLVHVYGPRDAPRYVLWRERASTSDGGG